MSVLNFWGCSRLELLVYSVSPKDLKNKEQLTEIKIYIGNQPPNYLGYRKINIKKFELNIRKKK